jgi:hypothetical protein
MLGVRQETEQTKQLPPPPKKLDQPKRQLPSPVKNNANARAEMDDDILF